MQLFTNLFVELDETNKTGVKVDALARYFRAAPPEDAAWGIYFLTGRRPKRPMPVGKLWGWAQELAGLPDWLFGECYDAVGDLAETIATILPPGNLQGSPGSPPKPLHIWVEDRLLPMQGLDEAEQKRVVIGAWSELDRIGRFVWNKLLTGALRVGVSQDLVIRALSQVANISPSAMAHRLMGNWTPSANFFNGLLAEEDDASDLSRPYPFCLAHPLAGEPESLGPIEDWHAEWKWDGIRCQLVKRQGCTFVWSRGEDLVSERFPEVQALGGLIPDGTVLDGEIMAWIDDGPMPFAELQKRIGRKSIGKKLLAEVPAVLVAFDLIEWQGEDIRKRPLSERRVTLEALVDRILTVRESPIALRLLNDAVDVDEGKAGVQQEPAIRLSPAIAAVDWAHLAARRHESRGMNVEGLMIKRRNSPYVVGRKKGFWWKWKIQPYSLDAVLIYAAKGSGIRASLYTDYTFGIWRGGELVPFAKAYSGLDDREIRDVDAFVRRNTLEKFGPVRTVKPELVFEIAFEGMQRSTRHKSGIAVRFPRIARWRHDKRPEEADTIETALELLGGDLPSLQRPK